jgi:hypothetical protein
MNTLYDVTRQSFLTGALNWTGGSTFGVLLVDTTQYTLNSNTNQYVSDIPSAAIIARQNLTNPTAIVGAASADALTIDNITGDVGAIVIYENTGTDTTSQLIAYIDTGNNLPSTYSAENVSLVWDTQSGNGIFKL